jgi:hypothetical protein
MLYSGRRLVLSKLLLKITQYNVMLSVAFICYAERSGTVRYHASYQILGSH